MKKTFERLCVDRQARGTHVTEGHSRRQSFDAIFVTPVGAISLTVVGASLLTLVGAM
jgi:hypothetical protein